MKILLIVALTFGIASGVVDISGKNYSDFPMFNGTDDMLTSEDLAGVPMSDMGLDEAFLKDNPADGKPINQSKPPLLLGSMTGITPAWLAGLDPMPLPSPAEQVAAYLNRSVV